MNLTRNTDQYYLTLFHKVLDKLQILTSEDTYIHLQNTKNDLMKSYLLFVNDMYGIRHQQGDTNLFQDNLGVTILKTDSDDKSVVEFSFREVMAFLLSYTIRFEVFVIEQQCPEDIEWEYEDQCKHYLAMINNCAAGTARWRATANGYKLERFAVLKHRRSEGVGEMLLKSILKQVPKDGKTIYLHAQIQAAPFYLKNGFVADGPHFYEADIEHVKMIWVP
jgi:predicted GNAT family N-acyltransferase